MAKEKDFTDNQQDKDRMKGTPASMDLPQMHDIPGQENIKPAPMGELADTTASSDDEEGKGVLDDEEPLVEGEDNVTEAERNALEDAATRDPAYEEEERMHQAEVDMTDDDGDPLNEGEELDVPGSEDDDEQEEIGGEDEENNEYSIDKND
ncbi:hypothetical protein ACFOTA_17485 [Chitinophaga sp. GCM10012297]|uniref:Uncharacterized protein n=1 Tax=Chitinophaga chungangae TaxID=2821488 RepID=A0ABS3YHW3_9BACT|nr:hypothetical protein [Chitinophaga chungangae]MBO9154015.1 hypothetical protein [Chitinophaga chungangae]